MGWSGVFWDSGPACGRGGSAQRGVCRAALRGSKRSAGAGGGDARGTSGAAAVLPRLVDGTASQGIGSSKRRSWARCRSIGEGRICVGRVNSR